jgi:hypothetical protein
LSWPGNEGKQSGSEKGEGDNATAASCQRERERERRRERERERERESSNILRFFGLVDWLLKVTELMVKSTPQNQPCH